MLWALYTAVWVGIPYFSKPEVEVHLYDNQIQCEQHMHVGDVCASIDGYYEEKQKQPSKKGKS